MLLSDFGETISYTPAGGGVLTMRGIESKAFVELAESFGTGVSASARAVKVRSLDLPPTATRGDAVATSSGSFRVSELQPDGTGFTLVMLEQAT